jgi:hypothetical protein
MSPPKPDDPSLQQQSPVPITPQPQHIQPAANFSAPTATPSVRRPHRSTKKKYTVSRRTRRKWTEQETNDLILGCREHGVGNWKKVLDDPRFNFNSRSSVDLKDRCVPFFTPLIYLDTEPHSNSFRTCFPKEYRKGAASSDSGNNSDVDESLQNSSTPGLSGRNGLKRSRTKTEEHHALVLEKLGIEGRFPKVQRRERREFTADEDRRLMQGFTIVFSRCEVSNIDELTFLGSTAHRGAESRMIPPFILTIDVVPTFAIGMMFL